MCSSDLVVAKRSYEAWLATQAAAVEADPEAAPEVKKAMRSLVRDAAAAWILRLRNV